MNFSEHKVMYTEEKVKKDTTNILDVPEASDIELSCVVITIDICKELNLYVIAK